MSATSDREAVLAANEAFYRAFESLELARMEQVWLRDQRIACVHPGWRRLTGWGPVMTSWERIFQSAFEMQFELRDAVVTVRGDLAVVLVEEVLTQRGYDGASRSQVIATNVFERPDGAWLMTLHHGSPILAPPDDEPPMQ
jgi:ketosteroid isomerase-like protein